MADEPVMPADVAGLVADWRNRMINVTPGPWKVYDGCSWRRIGTDHGRRDDSAVIAPTIASDGHQDLTCSRGNDREANLEWIAHCSPDRIESLLTALEALFAQNERLRKALEEIANLSERPYDKFPSDWRDQIAACPECQRYKDHPIQRGICDDHRKPLYDREDHNRHETSVLGYRAKSVARAALAARRALEGDE